MLGYISPVGVELVFSIIMTLVVYWIVPLSIIVSKKKYEKKTLKRIMICSGIGGFIFFSVLRIAIGAATSSNIFPAVFWSSIGYGVLQKKSCVRDGNKKNDKPKEKQRKNIKGSSKCNAKEVSVPTKGCDFENRNRYNQRNNSINNVKRNSENYSKNSLVSFISISVLILSIVSVISIVIAMNVQDNKRNYLENWNTTIIYTVLLIEFVCAFFVAVYSYKASKVKLLPWVSLVLVITTVFLAAEGSVFSNNGYDSAKNYYVFYGDMNIVTVFNIFWVVSVFLIFSITLLPTVITITRIIKTKWCRRVGYREKQYKKVAQMYNYLDKGIISKEEYEKVKKDILKNVE